MAARSLSWPLVPFGVLLSCAALERGPRLRGDSGATNGERIYRILLSVKCGGYLCADPVGNYAGTSRQTVGIYAGINPVFACLVDG